MLQLMGGCFNSRLNNTQMVQGANTSTSSSQLSRQGQNKDSIQDRLLVSLIGLSVLCGLMIRSDLWEHALLTHLCTIGQLSGCSNALCNSWELGRRSAACVRLWAEKTLLLTDRCGWDPAVPSGHLSQQCHYSQGFVPPSKGGTRVCTHTFQQIRIFAYCFSIPLPNHNWKRCLCLSLPPQPTESLRCEKPRETIALCRARDKKIHWNPNSPAAMSREIYNAWLPGQQAPQKVMELPGRMRRCCEREAVILSRSPQHRHNQGVGGSNWFQTLSHGRALDLAASQGSRFGIRVG